VGVAPAAPLNRRQIRLDQRPPSAVL